MSKKIERSSIDDLLGNWELALVACDHRDGLALHSLHVVRSNTLLCTVEEIGDLLMGEVLDGETETKRVGVSDGVRTS